jgi:hypothetical protein
VAGAGSRCSEDSSFTENLRLAFPLRPHDPYGRQPTAAEPVRVGRFLFTLGYLLDEEPEPLKIDSVALRSGNHLRANYRDVRRLQRLKIDGPHEVELLVAIGR